MRINDAFIHNMQGRTCIKRCIVIPIEGSGLVELKDGVYIQAQALQLEEKKGQSHMIDFKMGAKEKSKLNIIGGLTEDETQQNSID